MSLNEMKALAIEKINRLDDEAQLQNVIRLLEQVDGPQDAVGDFFDRMATQHDEVLKKLAQ